MFELLQNYKGKVIVNDIEFDSVEEARKKFNDYVGGIRILLKPENSINTIQPLKNRVEKQEVSDELYKIKVRKYMTSYGDDFFLSKMNSSPMPFMTMTGRRLMQTEKLVKMELWADISSEQETICCIKCGRELTNPISRYLHMGPECGALEHMKLIESGMSKEEAKELLQKELLQKKWTGWIIKSAILSAERVK